MTAPFASLADFAALLSSLPARDAAAVEAARARNGQLTKPPGALGRLEDLAIWVAGWQGTGRPYIKAPQVIIFAGNHGITAQGIAEVVEDPEHQDDVETATEGLVGEVERVDLKRPHVRTDWSWPNG